MWLYITFFCYKLAWFITIQSDVHHFWSTNFNNWQRAYFFDFTQRSIALCFQYYENSIGHETIELHSMSVNRLGIPVVKIALWTCYSMHHGDVCCSLLLSGKNVIQIKICLQYFRGMKHSVNITVKDHNIVVYETISSWLGLLKLMRHQVYLYHMASVEELQHSPKK